MMRIPSPIWLFLFLFLLLSKPPFMLSPLIFTLFFYLFVFLYMAFNILLAPNVACSGP